MRLSRHSRTRFLLSAVAVLSCGFARAASTDSGKVVADVFAPIPAVTKPVGMGRSPAGANTAADSATWNVSPADENFRVALGHWVGVLNSGALAPTPPWSLVWDFDEDIPITGSGDFPGPFKAAVRSLLESTELGDTPLKPCFYTNNVLRVIRMTAKCDPSE